MPADVRDVTFAEIDGSGQIAAPDSRAGDTLLIIHSDWVSMAAMVAPTGGGTWQLFYEQQGLNNGGTKVWKRAAAASEPSSYTVTGAPLGSGTAHCIAAKDADAAGIVIDALHEFPATFATVPTPGIDPPSASGLEIRYAAALRSAGTVSLGTPAGYTPRGTPSNSPWVGSALATRTLVSSASLGQVEFSAAAPVNTYVGLTIIVPSSSSSGGSGPPPTPPTFPAFVPTSGDADTRYTVHDYITGEYRGDLDTVERVSYGRRIGQETPWAGFVPLPSRREGDRLAEIIPRDRTSLATGPGRLVVHSWREGELMGMHWLIAALPARNGSKVGMQLQGTTLDGHWQRIYPTAPLDLDGDLLDVFRAALTDMQTTGSNLGLSYSAGTAGVSRPLLTEDTGTPYGQLLQGYARTGGGLEYVLNPTVVDGSIQRLVRLGAPTISNTDTEHVFVEGDDGGDIVGWRIETSALRGGTRIGVTGGTPPADDVTQSSEPVQSTLITTEHVAAGWPIYDLRINHPGASTDPQVVQDYAANVAARAGGAPSTFSVDVLLGKESTFHPNACGDWARFMLDNAWFPPTDEGGASFNLRQRIIGWQLTPAERGSGGKDKLTLITDQEVLA